MVLDGGRLAAEAARTSYKINSPYVMVRIDATGRGKLNTNSENESECA